MSVAWLFYGEAVPCLKIENKKKKKKTGAKRLDNTRERQRDWTRITRLGDDGVEFQRPLGGGEEFAEHLVSGSRPFIRSSQSFDRRVAPRGSSQLRYTHVGSYTQFAQWW